MKHVSYNGLQNQNAPKPPSYFSSSSYSHYDDVEDVRVQRSSVEDEFVSSLALVEDLHNRFRFMMTELKTSGLKVDE